MLNTPECPLVDSARSNRNGQSSGSLQKEHRTTGRIRAEMAAALVGVGSPKVCRCTATNIGSGGLFVQVPASAGLAVGQRFEVVLAEDRNGASELMKYLGEACFATVVRTEQLRRGENSMMGAGLRFDHPLIFWPAATVTKAG